MKDLVHYKTDSEPFALGTACREWMTPQKQTALPRLVTCGACLDWIAANWRVVITYVDRMRRSA